MQLWVLAIPPALHLQFLQGNDAHPWSIHPQMAKDSGLRPLDPRLLNNSAEGGTAQMPDANSIVSAGCEECKRLLDAFGDAVTEVVALHKTHFQAVVEDEPDPHRFDLLIHDANEKKQNAKYAYLLHREIHDCSSNDE